MMLEFHREDDFTTTSLCPLSNTEASLACMLTVFALYEHVAAHKRATDNAQFTEKSSYIGHTHRNVPLAVARWLPSMRVFARFMPQFTYGSQPFRPWWYANKSPVTSSRNMSKLFWSEIPRYSRA